MVADKVSLQFFNQTFQNEILFIKYSIVVKPFQHLKAAQGKKARSKLVYVS